jgi:hypothetical protein
VFVVAVGLMACHGVKLTPTGPEHPPRPENCDFQLFTALPSGYTEIAAIDVVVPWGKDPRTEISKFKSDIGPYVCKAGGDAAWTTANGAGEYIKATVLKRIEAPASAPSPDSEKAKRRSGCEYDTQCKGDRICVDRRGVSPPAPAAPAPDAS